jgi:glycerol-3-phosphate acyltransferase PlsY
MRKTEHYTNLKWDRHLFHLIAGSFTPIIGFMINWDLATIIAAISFFLLCAFEILRFKYEKINLLVINLLTLLLKDAEKRKVTGATYLAFISVVILLIFRSQPVIGGLALLYISIGDPIAAIVGIKFGKTVLFLEKNTLKNSQNNKTFEGTIAFALVTILIAYLIWTKGAYENFLAAALGAIIAALVEVLPIPIDDNISVPLISSFVMYFLWNFSF